MIPDRVQLITPLAFGVHAIMGWFLTLIVFGLLVVLNFPFQTYFILTIPLAFLPAYTGVHLDKRAMLKEKTQELNLHGFLECEFEDLDSDLIEACQRMEPRVLNAATSTITYSSTHDNHEFVFMLHDLSTNDTTIIFTACAVWTPLELSPTIIRRRRLKDRFSLCKDANEHPLGSYHIIESHNAPLIEKISMMHPWFAIKKSKPRHFRIHQPPGIQEQWSMNGHWVVYADLGNADTRRMLNLAEFLSIFMKELETNFQSNP